MLNSSAAQVGIELVDFYVPEAFRSVKEQAQAPAVDFGDARLPAKWNWTKDPHSLSRFFNSEAAAAQSFATELTQGDLARFIDQSGIERVFCATDESCSDMALKVANRLLARRPEIRKSIDAVICFHSTLNEEPNSSVAGRLQYELGLKGASAFAVGQKSGTASLMALKLACHLAMAEPGLDTFLLVGAEKIVAPYQRLFAGTTAISDGASAMLVRAQSEAYRILCVSAADLSCEFFSEGRSLSSGAETINRFLAEKAMALMGQVLSELGLEWKDVSLFLAPGFNASMNSDLKTRAGIPSERILTASLSRYGYLMNSDFAASLVSAMKESRIKRGDVILALSVGLDLSLACAALQV
jgi:3-oxoacyl-[acyl-carrier-protein] synthase III